MDVKRHKGKREEGREGKGTRLHASTSVLHFYPIPSRLGDLWSVEKFRSASALVTRGPTKSCLEPSGAARSRLDAVWSRSDTA